MHVQLSWTRFKNHVFGVKNEKNGVKNYVFGVKNVVFKLQVSIEKRNLYDIVI